MERLQGDVPVEPEVSQGDPEPLGLPRYNHRTEVTPVGLLDKRREQKAQVAELQQELKTQLTEARGKRLARGDHGVLQRLPTTA